MKLRGMLRDRGSDDEVVEFARAKDSNGNCVLGLVWMIMASEMWMTKGAVC